MKKIFEAAETVFIAVIFITIAILFFFRVIIVEGVSMENTLHGGEKIIITNFLYTPEKGDIVVTDSNNSYNKPLIKRVIATGGDTVKIEAQTGDVYINGQILTESYIKEEMTPPADSLEMTVPEGYLFLMGDNRNNSYDSRVEEIGAINEKDVLGKATLRISPFSKIGFVE